jgi:poly(hydroxyalkanoate) granule-associated protein
VTSSSQACRLGSKLLLSANIRESANRVWLGGLGAFAKTQEEGEKLFQTLVKEGEQVEKRARKAAEARIEDAKGKVVEFRGKANEQFDRLEELFQERVARVLNRMGVPTQEDIQELSKRVEALNESIMALKK